MSGIDPRIDAHHHFLDPARATYPWLAAEAMAPIRRSFGPDDLVPELAAQGISGTVLVQTLSSLDETRGFLGLATRLDFIWGVVGWVDLTSPAAGDDLDSLIDGPGGDRLVGVRHHVMYESDPDWLRRADVQRGLTAVEARGLTFDLLVRARELPAAVDAIAALPNLQFVLDHIAKPRIADGQDVAWQTQMPALAALPNVAVKLSGLVTEADWASWTPADLRPFVRSAWEWFGVERLMFGSDWPVCLLAATYAGVVDGLEEALGELSDDDRGRVFGLNAERVYGLQRRPASA